MKLDLGTIVTIGTLLVAGVLAYARLEGRVEAMDRDISRLWGMVESASAKR